MTDPNMTSQMNYGREIIQSAQANLRTQHILRVMQCAVLKG